METLYKTIHYSSWYIYLYKIINSRNLFSCYFLYNIPWIHHWLLFIQIFSPSNNNTCSASAQKKSNLSGECGDIHLICYGTCFALKVNNRKHELWCLDWVVSTKIGENQLYMTWHMTRVTLVTWHQSAQTWLLLQLAGGCCSIKPAAETQFRFHGYHPGNLSTEFGLWPGPGVGCQG